MYSPNFFAVLGLEPSLSITREQLDEALFAVQMNSHPDKVIHLPPQLQEEAFERSNLANLAYRQLKSLEGRIEHILQLQGLELADLQRSLPQSFLLEAFKWHEEVLQNRTILLLQLKKMQQAVLQEITRAIENEEYSRAHQEFAKLKFIKRFFYEHGGEDEAL